MPNCYFHEQSKTSATVTTATGFRDANARTSIAQKIKATATKSLTAVRQYFNANAGTLGAGNVWYELWDATGADPTAGSLLAATSTIAAASIADNAYSTFYFNTASLPSVTSGTYYYLVLCGDYTISATNYLKVPIAGSSSYADGSEWTYDGASWTDTTTSDINGLYWYDNADGGSFDVGASCQISDLETLKGGASVASTDSIYVYNGSTFTVEKALACTVISLGETWNGAATTTNRWAIFDNTGSNNVTFAGGTGSGIKSSPASPETGATGSIQSIIKLGSATYTNAGGTGALAQIWGINCAYGSITGVSPTLNYTWGAAMIITQNSTYSSAAEYTVDITGTLTSNNTGSNHAAAGYLLYNSGGYAWNRKVRVGAIVWTVAAVNVISVFYESGGTTASGWAHDVGAIRFINTNSAGRGQEIRTLQTLPAGSAPDVYVGRYHECAGTDIRPTTTAPADFTVVDNENGETLKATISNIASYADADMLMFYNDADDALVGAGSVAQYNAAVEEKVANCLLITGLTNDTAYTLYAKATSDQNTFSAESGTDSATPTAPAGGASEQSFAYVG